jgi:xylitol oxidase
MVVHLGALGVVTRLTLDVQPSYLVRQEIFEQMGWNAFLSGFGEIMSSADSVSLFTDYGEAAGNLWCKTRVDPDGAWAPANERFGARAATRALHPVPDFPADACTDQLGVPGRWFERVPHFRMDAIPSAGEETQAEYMVPRRRAVEAIEAVRALAARIRPVLLIAEIRTVAADDLWMSSAYGRDTVCLHFTWKPDREAVDALLPVLEAELAPFQPRPHWGKLFAATAAELEPRYERMAEFRALAERLDPRGAFRNAFLVWHVLGE